MGLITETNEEYYAGEKVFLLEKGTTTTSFTAGFNTALKLGTSGYNQNFKLEYSENLGVTWQVYSGTISSVDAIDNGSVVNINPGIAVPAASANAYLARITLVVTEVFNNYGGYAYSSLNDIVNTFIATYVGTGKIIPSVKRTDVIFHAKRGLQEFSYDTLKSVKSQELTIPPSLSIIMPQDYVNYVRMSWIDGSGIKHIIYPSNNLTINPYETPLQNIDGDFVQDGFGENTEGSSITEARWKKLQQWQLSGGYNQYLNGAFNAYGQDYMYDRQYRGMRYGLLPETTQINGYFTINEREGKFSFSSDLNGRVIVLEYVSDGLAYDIDSKVPKMAEEAMYMHIAYSLLAGRSNIPEYLVARFKKDRRAQLRNAKIRLSNIKIDEITRVMRNKSKWIKH